MIRKLPVLAVLLLLGGSGYAYYASITPTVNISSLATSQKTLAQGEYVLYAGGCISCHQAPDKDTLELSGGLDLKTPFGTFYVPNITPDPSTGIGNWSDEDFIRAFRFGVSPERQHYFPAFPYTAYTGIKTADLLALKTYLFAQQAVNKANKPHELAWLASFRPLLTGWKWLHFSPAEWQPDPNQTEQWNRGAYLVNSLGHCAECHTPRTLTGGLDLSHFLAGNPDGPEGEAVPSLLTNENGIGDWEQSDLEFFLEIGMKPDGDFAGSTMSAVIDDNTGRLTAQDRQAIVHYLVHLEP